MRHVLLNVRKAVAFDLVLSKVAEACAHQLLEVLFNPFNLSLTRSQFLSQRDKPSTV